MPVTDPDLVFTALGAGAPVDYVEAWELQRQVHAARVAGAGPDTVLLLEHASVYTAGRRTQQADRPTDGSPVVEVDRGGRITWHGPGQLVGYPIVALPDPVDVVAHVRRLEDALVGACGDLALATTRVRGRSGVWVLATGGGPDRKIAAIGTRVAQGVTMHGFALNVDCDLAEFTRIVPCGLTDAGVTSTSAELGRHVGVADVVPLVRERLRELVEVSPDPGPTTPAGRRELAGVAR